MIRVANSPDKDLSRAKDFRRMAREAKDASAKRTFTDTADRLERRAAQKANKVGRRRRRSTGAARLNRYNLPMR